MIRIFFRFLLFLLVVIGTFEAINLTKLFYLIRIKHAWVGSLLSLLVCAYDEFISISISQIRLTTVSKKTQFLFWYWSKHFIIQFANKCLFVWSVTMITFFRPFRTFGAVGYGELLFEQFDNSMHDVYEFLKGVEILQRIFV